jgi:phosphatidate cytidylyltransferase
LNADQTTSAALQAPLTRRRFDGRRVIPALIFVPLFYALVRYAPPAAFFIVVAAAALLALAEFHHLHFRDRRAPFELALGCGTTLALLVSLQWPWVVSEHTALVVALVAALASRLVSPRDLKTGLVDSAAVLLGVIYVGATLGHLLLLRALPDGVLLIFFLFLVTWAGDTGAYCIGLGLGRRKLAPVISPNKTVEGLIGGLALSVIAAVVARAWFLVSWTLTESVTAALLVGVAGVVGDLVESALKRSAGVKDSGWLIPAHGGMLDRLDSLLFAAPALYYYVALVKG